MKFFLKTFLFHVFSLWVTSEIFSAFRIHGAFVAILTAAGILTFLSVFVKPLLKILFIPINLLTLGFFSWFTNVIVIYLLTVLAPEVEITAWKFMGWHWGGFALPAFGTSYIVSLILVSCIITIVGNLLHWITE